MEEYIDRMSISKYPSKQVLPSTSSHEGSSVSLVIDDDYLAHLHAGNERIELSIGQNKNRFNCIRIAECKVLRECVRSISIFAHTVIIEDSTIDCEEIYFNVKNELEVKSGKMRFSAMNVEAKWVTLEQPSLITGNQIIITASRSTSFSGEYKLENLLLCRSQQISIAEHCSIATSDLMLLPTKSLEIRGALHCKNLFIGELCEKLKEVVNGTAKVKICGKVEGDKMSVLTSNEIVLSGELSMKELDCSSGEGVEVVQCRLKSKKLQVHAQTTTVDAVSILEGTEFSFMVHDKIVLYSISSFQCDGLMTFECRSLLCGGVGNEETSACSTFRSRDVYITAAESIALGGELKCKKLILKCEQHAANVIFRENTNFDLESLLVFGNDSRSYVGEDELEIGKVLFDNGSVILCSMFVAIEADKEVVLKGSLKRALCYSPNLSIKTTKSIKFVNCSVGVGETQLLFGDKLVLDERANVCVSGKLFLLQHPKQINPGVLRIAKNCVLVARKEIVCQFGECYVEGTLASEEESVLLGRNDNQSPSRAPEGTEKKDVKIHRLIKQVVRSLKPTSNPLSSLFKKIQEKRIELLQSFQRIIHWREEDAEQKSFVMEFIFISGEVRAKKTVMLVSRDISIQNGSSIKCTSAWDNTAILMYSNRSVFQCSSELDASTVLIVSPIVFQLLSLIKAHNLSISAAAVFRLACLYNSTKTIVKSPLILSGLNVVAPNVSKTLHKMRCDLVESCVDVVMLIERLAEARIEHREFSAFLVESMKLFKKHSHLTLLHSLELVHFAFQIVNLLVPKTALIITMNVMSIVRATMFLLFSVKSIQKSIKRYLTSERQNFILVEIVGEGMFSLYQVVGVVTSFTSLFNQLKSVLSSGMNSSSVGIPTLKNLREGILNRTRELISRGPLSALSNVLGVFDTFVLNDYTKYAVGLFSYLPSSMSFSILNLSGELQLGMYVVNSSTTCSLNGSVVVLSYNCSSNNIASFNPRSSVVICNGGIYETSAFGKVDRGVKISQRSLVLTGGRRIHDGGFHFGESVVLKTRSFEQLNNRLIYNQIGGFSMKEWKLNQSDFRPVSSSDELSRAYLSSLQTMSASGGVDVESFDGSVIIRSGNVIEDVSVGNGSVFYLKDVSLKMNNVSGAITMKNVQVRVSNHMEGLSSLQIAGGNNSVVSDCDIDVDFAIHLAEGGHLNVFSSSTIVNCTTDGEGHIAFHNAEIGEKASVQHSGSMFIDLKDSERLCDAISGSGKYSKIANDGQLNFKVNGEFELSASDENLFLSETSVREKQDLGIIANSIDICREVVRKKGIQLFSSKEDVVIRKSITSEDGSVVINAKHGKVIVEDSVEKGIIATKCRLESKHSREMSRMETEADAPGTFSSYKLTVVDGVDFVKKVEKVELRAKDSVFITANEGSIILDPCVIHGDESVVLEGKRGVLMKDICVTSVSRKNSRNPFFSKRKKVVKGVAETTSITSNGDISIIASEGTVVTSGVSMNSNEGRIFQSGRDGVINQSTVTEVFIKEKKRVLGGLSQEQRKEKHDVETPCVFESTEGFYVESERGSIVNVGVLATGNGVCSFKAGENVLLERRTLNHEVCVKKQGFDLSLSILGADIFESSSTFFENLKLEFLENNLPPIGNSPIEVARSIREGNVPEIAANLANALLIPGNLRFILEAPIKIGLKFNDYDFQSHKYDTLGEGKIEMDHLYINAVDTVEFSNAFGFNAGSVEIEAHKLIEHGAFLSYELENFSSGFGFSVEPFGGDILPCVPSMSVDLSVARESCSIAVCQVGNAALMNVNVEEWDKYGSQTFAETVEGRVGTISFDSTCTVTEGKMHGISLGTTSLGLSDGHSRSSLIVDQTGLYAVNVGGLEVKTVFLKSSRCPVRGTDSTIAEESMEFEKVSGTSLGVDFSGFLSISAMVTAANNGGGKQISKLKGVGIEKRDYLAVVENSFENVNESEFHYRAIDPFTQNEVEREAMAQVEAVHQNYETLTRKSGSSLFMNKGEADDGATVDTRSTLLTPAKNVLKDRGFKLKLHYDRNYHGIEQMHKEVVDEGLLPCLEGAAFEDVDPQLLYPVLDIFYDPSTSELDKYTQMLFFRDGEKSKFCDLTESEKQEVFIYQSYLQAGGDFRDYISLCKLQSLTDEYAKKSMKEYVRETYPGLYLSTGLHDVEDVEDVQRVFMDIKFAFEPDDPIVRQLTFEMDQYYAEKIFNASWAELSSSQQKEIVEIREHALIYQQTDQEIDFGEYLLAKEAQFVEYFANHHQEPDTSVLTAFGVLPIELLKEPDPIFSECMPYQVPLFDNDNERKYPAPGSGLFFLIGAPEKGGWEGLCEFASSVMNCFVDYFSYALSGRPEVDCHPPSQIELFRDKSLRSFFSGVLDFVPYVNGVKWGFQGIAGYNPITKDRLDWSERMFDLTFSMFYFPPVGSVIIGYGKGAVWEPMKGAWNVGKILVKERTMKGVFETLRMTGASIVDSIALPTQHLGIFLEMKMLWGINSGVASMRSAGAWASNMMNKNWKGGFWNKWKWSRRNFDVMVSRFTANGTNYAFAGSFHPTTTSTPGNSYLHRNEPFMRFAKEDNKYGRFVKGREGRGKVFSKGKRGELSCSSPAGSKGKRMHMKSRLDSSQVSLQKPSNVGVKSSKWGNSQTKGSVVPLQDKKVSKQKRRVTLDSVPRNYLLQLISEKLYDKLHMRQWKSKKPRVLHLPLLDPSEYSEIAKRFNKEPRVGKKFKRTVQQIASFRRRNRKEVLELIRMRIAKNPLSTPNIAGVQLAIKSKQEHIEKLVEMISEKLYEKAAIYPFSEGTSSSTLIASTDCGKTEEGFFNMRTKLTESDYEAIAKRFNEEHMKMENSINVHRVSANQVKVLRTRRRTSIHQMIQKKNENDPRRQNGPVLGELQSSSLLKEHKTFLIEMYVEKLFERSLELGQTQINFLPMLRMVDYESITRQFNKKVNANMKRSITQVIRYRYQIRKEVQVFLQTKLKNSNCGVVLEHTGRLQDEQKTMLVDIISEKLYKKALGRLESGQTKGLKFTAKLSHSECKEVAKRFNRLTEMRDNPQFRRTAKQVKIFRRKQRRDIYLSFQERITSLSVSHSHQFPLDDEQLRASLLELVAEKIYDKAVITNSWKSQVRRLPKLTQGDYNTIAVRYNSLRRVRENPLYARSAQQIKNVRSSEKEVVLQKVKERLGVEKRWSDINEVGDLEAHAGRLRNNQRALLFELLSEKLFKKITLMLKAGKTDIPYMPNLSDWDYGVIARRFNGDPILCENPENKKTVQQIKRYRMKYMRSDLFEYLRNRIAKEKLKEIYPESEFFSIHPVTTEQRTIILDEITDLLFEKALKSGKTEVRSYESYRDLPRLTDIDYVAISERYNANRKVNGDARVQRTAQQIRQYRALYREVIMQDLLRRIREI